MGLLGGMAGVCRCVIGLQPNCLSKWLHQFLPSPPTVSENLNLLAEQGFTVQYIFVKGALNANGYSRV